jgi:hypothetical protein
MEAKLIFANAMVCVGANLSGCASGSEPSPNTDNINRGNTPPGKDRAGDGPASGTIVDPAGVLKK